MFIFIYVTRPSPFVVYMYNLWQATRNETSRYFPKFLHGVRAWLGDGGAGRRGELAAVRAGGAARGGGVSVSIGRVQSEERAGGAGWSWRGEIPNRRRRSWLELAR